jgi:hypothetical protein
MTAGEQAADNSQKDEFSFKGCEEMMKKMCACMGGKEGKVDFDKLRKKMAGMCREMMKKGGQS